MLHAEPRLEALYYKYALSTYSLANFIFSYKHSLAVAITTCSAAHSSITDAVAQVLCSFAGMHAEDARVLAGHCLTATIACAALVMLWRTCSTRPRTALEAAESA
jgi:hypothetical protein